MAYLRSLIATLTLFLLSAGPALAGAQFPLDHPTCRDLTDLAARYGTTTPAVAPGSTTIGADELARHLAELLTRVADKCAKEGAGAVPAEDLARLNALRQALQSELEGTEAYRAIRDTIDRLLIPQEAAEPSFIYKYGVNGFLRGEAADNFRLTDFSHDPGHGQGRILYRLKPYLYWHPREGLDIHLEGQGAGFSGGTDTRGKFALYQGYLEVWCPRQPALAIKGGRQEFTYGSAFILGSDASVKGRAYDGGRLRLKPTDTLTLDLLGGNLAPSFADGTTGTLFGGYVSYTPAKGRTLDAYILRDSISPAHHSGEYEVNWGARLTLDHEPFTLEIEPVYQTGWLFNPATGMNDRIAAYGGHLDLDTDTTMAGIHNHVFASIAYGSGNSAGANGITGKGEFRTPLNDSSLMGDMKVIGDLSGFTSGSHRASGLQVYTLGWGVDVTKEVNLTGTGRLFRANAVDAGLGSIIGTEADFTLTWNLGDNLSLLVGYDHFFTGGFIATATGSSKDIDYGYIMLQFDLSRKKLRPPAGKG